MAAGNAARGQRQGDGQRLVADELAAVGYSTLVHRSLHTYTFKLCNKVFTILYTFLLDKFIYSLMPSLVYVFFFSADSF